MEGKRSDGVDSLINNCDLKEEVSDDDTDNLSDDKVTDTTLSEEDSSTQFCSLSSGPVRNERTFQRHPSVDEWLLGLSITVSSEDNNYEHYKDSIGYLTPVANRDEDKNNDKMIQTDLNKRGRINHEAFFQTCDVKEIAHTSANYSYEKDDIQDGSEISESVSETSSNSQEELKMKQNNNKEEKELEFKAMLNILSDNSVKSVNTLQENIEPLYTDQVNVESFKENRLEFHTENSQKKTDENPRSDLKSLENGLHMIFHNHQENNINLEKGNLKYLCVSNSSMLEQDNQVKAHSFSNGDCEQARKYVADEPKVEHKHQLFDLDNSHALEFQEQLETSLSEISANCSETGLSLKENYESLHTHHMDYKTFKDSRSDFDSKDNEESKQTNEQLSKKDSGITEEMFHFPHDSNEGSDISTDKNNSIPAKDENRGRPKKEDDQVKSCLFSIDDVGTDKPIMRRSKSLKTCRTPPGKTSCPKLVRFADILGLDLSVTRVFADEIPKIPKAAFLDLDVDNIDSYWANNKAFLLPPTLMPRPTQLVPIFPQPASLVQFFDLVHCHKICLESAQMTGLTTLTGDVRVLNISFHKLVVVIWTVDNWATKMESTCEYVPGSSEGITDKFRFHLETAGLAVGSRVHLCIRYETGEQVFWDNNLGQNYVFRVGEKSGDRTELERDFLS